MVRAISAALCLFSLLGGSLIGGPAVAADDAVAASTATVERFHQALIDSMKAGDEAGFEGRRKRLDPVVRETFDLPAMARLSTGGGWGKMSTADRARIVTAFTDWTVASYAANFKEWDGEAFATEGHTDDGRGNIVINTKLIPKTGSAVAFDYRMRKQDDAWRVVDIYLDGAVSQLAMRRSEFGAVLARGTIDDLLKHMRDLTEQAAKDGA